MPEHINKVTPKISIIIPIYNAFPYIKEMLDSIQTQTFTDWELILVDDGSTDNGPQLINTYVESDHRITYVKRPDDRIKGACTCRNIGLEMIKGEYVIWFDADDIIAPYCLQQRVDYMDNNMELDFAVFPALSFKIMPGDSNDLFFGYRYKANFLCGLINKNLPFVVWNNIYRVSSIKKYEIKWDENLKSLQDSDFNILTIVKGLKFKETNLLPDYFWRQTPSSISRKIFTEHQFKSHLYFLNKTLHNFEEKREFNADLQLDILWTIEIIKSNPIYFEQILLNDYFKHHRLFRYKLRKYFNSLNSKKNFFNKRMKILLFPYLEMRRRFYGGIRPFNRRYNKIKEELFEKFRYSLSH